jgi:hypothetical protein
MTAHEPTLGSDRLSRIADDLKLLPNLSTSLASARLWILPAKPFAP